MIYMLHIPYLKIISVSMFYVYDWWSVTFLFPALSLISSPNSNAYILPQAPYRPIYAPIPLFSISFLLPSAINYIQDYYYLILSLLYIHKEKS